MNRFFKTFLILLFALFSLGLGNGRAENTYINTVQNSVYQAQTKANKDILLVAAINNDSAIVSSNNNGYEIYSYRHNFESGKSINGNYVVSNDLFKQKLANNCYSNISCNSHNISPILKNEICTRAP